MMASIIYHIAIGEASTNNVHVLHPNCLAYDKFEKLPLLVDECLTVMEKNVLDRSEHQSSIWLEIPSLE
jgi:hypothetical protein